MPARCSVIPAVVTLLAMALELPAAPGDLDLGFQSSRGASDTIQTVVEQPDGKMIIAGDFTAVDGIARNRIARLNPDGSLDRRFMSGLAGANSLVRTVVLQSDGKILIGGFFTTIHGVARSKIARLNADGTLDTSFLSGLSGVGNYGTALGVYRIVLQPDGKVLIGGAINLVNGAARGGVARLNADGSVDTGFMDGLAGADSTVRAVVLQPDGKVLIGGYFSTVNGVTRRGIARLNSNGALDDGFQSDITGTGYQIKAIALQSDGKLVLGGMNISVGGVARRVARLNNDGTDDAGFSGNSGGMEIRALAVQPDGYILAGSVENGPSDGRVQRLNPDGTADTSFRASFTFGTTSTQTARLGVETIVLRSDSTILVGGNFIEIGNSRGSSYNFPCNRLVRLLSNGQVDPSLVTAQTGTSGIVSALAIQADRKVLASGGFGKINGSPRGRLVRLNSDGTADTVFPVDLVEYYSPIRALAVQDDNKILLGGDFSTVLGEAHYYAARLDSDGTLDSTFLNSLPVTSNPVSSIAIQEDGKVVVAGNKESQTQNSFSMARLNGDGTVDGSFVHGLDGVASQVWSVVTLTDGKILVGGDSKVAASPSLWRLKSDGSLDTGFTSFLGGASIRALAEQSDGKILVGGSFGWVTTAVTRNVARLKSDGTLDQGFISGLSGTDGIVHCLALQTDGKVLIGGEFTKVNGVARNGIARLNTNGSLDTTFLSGQAGVILTATNPPSFYPWPSVETIRLQSDGRIVIGGYFNSVNGIYRGNIARLHGDAPDIAVEQPAGNAILHDSSTAVNFGPVPAGESISLAFTLRNAGNLNLTGLALTKGPGNALADFTIGNPGTDSLAPNAITTFAVSFSPQAPATRTVLLEIASNDPDESPFLLRLTGNQASSLDLWRREHFGSFSNAGAGGNLSDPDGDGTGNLLEFATGTDPLTKSPPSWQLVNSGDVIEFTYTRPRAALEALRYDVEWCDAPGGPWFTAGPGTVLNDDGTMQQVKASVPAAIAGRRFVRLRVTALY